MSLTWDDFCEEYFLAEGEGSASTEEQMELLEGFLEHPLNLNQASRSDLLKLPFIREAQADSILEFRERKHGFISFGDLMFIRNLAYTDRLYLRLFATIGDVRNEPKSLREQFFGGHHTVETRLDIPLYKRAGQMDIPDEILKDYPNRKYLGNGLANVVRYRYRQHQDVRYGITLEKDAGEPFGNRNNYPYDFVSAYILYELPSHKARLLAGDYRVDAGQGLLFGSQFLNSRNFLLDAAMSPKEIFRPHTGTEENKFFRGAAASIFLKNFSLSVFASYNKVDARLDEGVVRSLTYTGLHRTLTEINSKNAVGNFTTGGRLSYGRSNWEVGFTGFFTHFDKEFQPEDLPYNEHNMHGKNTAAISADWWVNLRRWTISGEVAADANMHPAMSQTIVYQPLDELSFTLQHRHLSRKFVSIYGETSQQGSTVANEQGLMFGGKYSGIRKLELRAYADVFFFPGPSFTASQPSNGLEVMAEGNYHVSQTLSFLLRYKVKSRKQNVAGYADLLEYRQTHRIRCAAAWQKAMYQLRASLDATISLRQSAAAQWGWAASLRAAVKPAGNFSASASASIFFTDDYASAVYLYEPRLRHTFSNMALFYHGFRIAAVASWKVCKWLELGAKYGCLHFFNKNEIGSGPQQIMSPTKQDISVQMMLKF